MSMLFSTDQVPVKSRLEYWRDAVCEVFFQLDIDVDTRPDPTMGFDGCILQHATGALNFSEVIVDGHTAIRGKRQLSMSTEDCFLLIVQRGGKTLIEQDGRRACLEAGQFALFDSTRPYEMHLPEHIHHQVLKIPGSVLRDTIRGVERFTARAIAGDSGAGRIFLGLMGLLRENIQALDQRGIASVADSLVDLLSATIGTLPEAQTRLPTNIELYHRERVKQAARERLFDPDLSVELIANSVQLSLRYVHKLFESEPMTLAAWIWHERLEAARRILASPTNNHRSLTEISYAVGFKDLAHFSRMFKSIYGLTPREFRTSLAEMPQDDPSPASVIVPGS